MTQDEINQRAFQVYAAIGELYVKQKQAKQILESYTEKIEQLEQQIVNLSKTPLSKGTSHE